MPHKICEWLKHNGQYIIYAGALEAILDWSGSCLENCLVSCQRQLSCHRQLMPLGGSGGMPPKENFEFSSSEIAFWAIL